MATTAAFPAALRAEFIKLRTLRSTAWTLAAALTVTTGVGVMLSLLNRYASAPDGGEPLVDDPVFVSFSGMTLGQLAMILFGTLAVTGEYTSGMVRTSLQAVPDRALFLAAKTTAVGVTALAAGLLTAGAAFFAGQAALGPYGTSLGEPGVARAVLGACVYQALLAMFAVGAAMALRTALLSVGVLFPFFFLISPTLSLIPATRDVAPYLPDAAGMLIMQVESAPGPLGPWSGSAVMVLWVAAALAAGCLVLRGRDA
ncbi:ABC transporter permease [Streptomyces pratensis]|uniref:ABC transporter permease n=1 Tax=Streptomyces pratensis TaxID=1169025 RepID=UPI003018189C